MNSVLICGMASTSHAEDLASIPNGKVFLFNNTEYEKHKSYFIINPNKQSSQDDGCYLI